MMFKGLWKTTSLALPLTPTPAPAPPNRFGANELATRINHAQPKVILAGSCGLEPGRTVLYQPLVDQAIEIASHKPEKVWWGWRHLHVQCCVRVVFRPWQSEQVILLRALS